MNKDSYPVSPQQRDDRSIAQLLSDAMHQTADLLRKEIALAKAEIGDKLAAARTMAIVMAVGGLLAFAGLLIVLGAVVLIVDLYLHQPWLSALIVGLVTILIGAAAMLSVRGMATHASVMPERTARSLRHDKQLVTEHLT